MGGDTAGLISVIVPVYNSSRYIEECIGSVLAQTYQTWELLLIDDGSMDDSRELCHRWCEKDDRIKLICRDHMGVSAARNAGIGRARGKYLFFLDSDDVIHHELFKTLYTIQEKTHAKIAVEGRYYAEEGPFCEPEQWERSRNNSDRNFYCVNEYAIQKFLYGDRTTTLYVMGGKMILRDAVRSLRFQEKITHGEDTLFLYQLLKEGADVVGVRQNWYYYRSHKNSVSRVYSVRTCESRYRVQRYIRKQELKCGRIANGIHWETVMICAMIKWYQEGLVRSDNELVQYVSRLAKREKALKIFHRIAVKDRMKFYLVFTCWPYLWRFLRVKELTYLWKGSGPVS